MKIVAEFSYDNEGFGKVKSVVPLYGIAWVDEKERTCGWKVGETTYDFLPGKTFPCWEQAKLFLALFHAMEAWRDYKVDCVEVLTI